MRAHAAAMGALVGHRGSAFPLPPPPGTPALRAADMFATFGLPLVVLPAALVVAVVALLRARRRARPDPTDRTDPVGAPPPAELLALALAGAGTLPYALSRPDLFHFVPPYAFACALAAAALGRLERRLGEGAGRSALVLAALVLVVSLGLRARAALALRADPDHVVSSLPGVRGITLPAATDATWTRTVEAVQRRVPPDRPLFVGCARHDRVHLNDGLLYVLCRRPVATRHHCFNPGVTTSLEKQRALVRELESAAPPAVVLVQGLAGPARDDPAGSELLDRWLARNYARAETFGGYGVFARR